jgi:hypothetical protein
MLRHHQKTSHAGRMVQEQNSQPILTVVVAFSVQSVFSYNSLKDHYHLKKRKNKVPSRGFRGERRQRNNGDREIIEHR